MKDLFARDAPRRPVNVSVNSDLLNQARQLDINLSATLEAALATALRSRRREQWLKESRGAIDAYNEYVETHGVFSDGKRTF
jgi:antitoxin CcdA